MTLTTQTVRTKILPVAVVDTFRRDMKKAGLVTSHGELVEAFIGSDVETVKFDTSKYKASDLENSWQQYSLALKELIEKVEEHGLKVSALNLSSSFNAPIDFLAEIFDMKLSRFNLGKNRDELHEKVFNMPEQVKKIEEKISTYRFRRKIADKRKVNTTSIIGETVDFKTVVQRSKTLCEIIELLEKIRKLGIQVFISAGNKGQEMVNLLTLIEGTHVVGAGNSTESESYSCDNDLVNAHEQGTFWLARRKNNGQEDVLKINFEGCRKIAGDSVEAYDFNRYLCGHSVKLAHQHIPHYSTSDYRWQLHSIVNLNSLIQRVAREDLRYDESDVSFFEGAPEKGMYFVLSDNPDQIMFFDERDGVLTECTKFVYPLYGTSYATPLFLRKYLRQNSEA